MSTRLGVGVELLERSLAYTRVALAEVRPTSLTRRTPCARWDLGALLAHMDDALDAFLEAAGGSVAGGAAGSRPPSGPVDVAGLRDKACALLGTWTVAASGVADPGGPAGTSGPRQDHDRLVEVDGLPVLADLLVSAAALEITAHGWDVATALGLDHPLPDGLAEALLPVARDVAPLGPFAAPLPTPVDAPPGVRLLGLLGRSPA